MEINNNSERDCNLQKQLATRESKQENNAMNGLKASASLASIKKGRRLPHLLHQRLNEKNTQDISHHNDVNTNDEDVLEGESVDDISLDGIVVDDHLLDYCKGEDASDLHQFDEENYHLQKQLRFKMDRCNIKSSTIKIRDVQSFFQKYINDNKEGEINKNENYKNRQTVQNPISELQSRYNSLQHKQNPKSRQKSIRKENWFRDRRWGKLEDLWWTCDVVVPVDIAHLWGVNSVVDSVSFSSGSFPLNSMEMQLLKEAYDGRDLLLELCGKYKHSEEVGKNENYKNDLVTFPATGKILFKNKSAAQRSAAFNFLLAMDLGKCDSYEPPLCDGVNWANTAPTSYRGKESSLSLNGNNISNRTSESEQIRPRKTHYPNWVDCLHDLGVGRREFGARYELKSISYLVSCVNPLGDYFSTKNPSTTRCIFKLIDQSSSNNEELEVRSKFEDTRYDSRRDAIAKLATKINGTKSLVQDDSNHAMSNKEFIENCNPKSVCVEAMFPDWTVAEIKSDFYLYELEFWLQNDHIDGCGDTKSNEDMIPLSEAIGLGDEATKVGIVLGKDLFDEGVDFERELTSSFFFPKVTNVLTGEEHNNPCLRVRMHNRTQLSVHEMMHQIKRISPKLNIQPDEDPVILMKSFNMVLRRDYKNASGGFESDWDGLMKSRLEMLNESSSCGRSYLFVPLLEINRIDWETVWNVVHHNQQRAYWRFDMNVCLPCSFFWWTSIALLLVATTASVPAIAFIYNSCFESFTSQKLTEFDLFHLCESWHCFYSLQDSFELLGKTEKLLICVSFVLIAMLSAIDLLVKPTKASPSVLRNRFLQQHIGFKNKIFVAKLGGSINSYSPIFPHDVISTLKTSVMEEFRENTRLMGMENATRAEYYGKLQGRPLRYPTESLINASLVTRHLDHNYLTIAYNPAKELNAHSFHDVLARDGHLLPELVTILPMPRDMLYLCQQSSIFMPGLERMSTLIPVAFRLREIQHETCNLLGCNATVAIPTYEQIILIDKAIPICDNNILADTPKREHERLESLGDAVLLFFIVVNILAKNVPNVPDCGIEKFAYVVAMQGKNKVLLRAAKLLGLYRLVQHSSSSRWKSCYDQDVETEMDYKIDISEKRMSDIFESFLGAAYLIDPTISIGLLNEAGSCFPEFDEGESFFLRREKPFFVLSLNGTFYLLRYLHFPGSTNWFVAKGSIKYDGFPFREHADWDREMKRLHQIVQSAQHIFPSFEKNFTGLCHHLGTLANSPNIIYSLQSDSYAIILLKCALFDYSFGDDEYESTPEDLWLERLAIMREKIFHVGNASLQLKVVEELYHRYCDATSGDIHLHKIGVLSMDSLAYVFIKNGFHEFLFDRNAVEISTFQTIMEEADELGSEEWERRGGWIISGGIDEFLKRVVGTDIVLPRYPGLAAGRIFGRSKKLEQSITNDLQFSMKCVFGALVLSVGLENAWTLIRPVFLELLVLSPDELRTCYEGISPVVSFYSKGRH